jgi:beta-glucanase (GH16 family)
MKAGAVTPQSMFTSIAVRGCPAARQCAPLDWSAGLALLVLLCACSPRVRPGTTTPAPPSPPLAGYRLAWHDEFGGAALDTSRWTVYLGPRRDARNAADAVSVAAGALTITTYTDSGTHFTGFLDTAGKFLATYGWFEARVRFESSPGEWGAFWLNSPTIGHPVGDPGVAGAEIDVVEHRALDSAGADISNSYGINVHWDGYGADHKHVGGGGAPGAGAAPLQGAWHVYALRWTAESYTFYLDGVEQWATRSGVSHRPEFIKLSCEVQNGSWAGGVPPAGYGSRGRSATRMQVDWVRVWQEAP